MAVPKDLAVWKDQPRWEFEIASQPLMAEAVKMCNNGFGQIMAWLRVF